MIDSRHRSKKPLIATTKLTLDELNNAPDTARQRIYDRILELCTPIFFSGENFRRAGTKEKMRRFRNLRKERSPDDQKDVAKGYFKKNGTKTAEDIMTDVLKAEYEAGLLTEDNE